MKSSLRTRLTAPNPLLGTIMTLNSPEIAEILVSCGYDWLFLDMEHSPLLDLQAVQRIVQVSGSDVYVVVRAPANDAVWIKKILDTGCDGVMLPQVRNDSDARSAVAAAKYPPAGHRSIGVARAHGYGANFQDYLERANDDIAVIVQVEHINAVNTIEKIVEVKGIDAVFIGPFDLSGSMEKLGEIDHPEVHNAIARVRKACADAAMPLGIYAGTPESARTQFATGVRLVAVGTDTTHLLSGARHAFAGSHDIA